MRKRKIETITKEIHEDDVVAFELELLDMLIHHVLESIKNEDEIALLLSKIESLTEDGTTLCVDDHSSLLFPKK